MALHLAQPSAGAYAIRRAAVQDLDALVAIVTDPAVGSALYAHEATPPSPDEVRDDWRVMPAACPTVFLVAVDAEGVAIGAAFVDETAAPDGHGALGFLVDPSHQGRGVAGALMAAAVTAAPCPLMATVVRTNRASIVLLERHGFRFTGFACEAPRVVLAYARS